MVYVKTADVPFNYIISKSRCIGVITPVIDKDIGTARNIETADLITRITKIENMLSRIVRPDIACIKLMDLKSGDIIYFTNPSSHFPLIKRGRGTYGASYV